MKDTNSPFSNDTNNFWPQWAEETRIDDDLLTKAYENTEPKYKAAIKTGLALSFMYFGQNQGTKLTKTTDTHKGFWQHETTIPAPWAIIALTDTYDAPARVIAACIPAQLANIQTIGVVFIGKKPNKNILVSLELCGIENIFLLNKTQLCTLLEELQPGPGRLVLLHNGELDSIAQNARLISLPFYEERQPPILNIPEPSVFDIDILKFAHGNIINKTLESTPQGLPAAIFINSDAAMHHCEAHSNISFRQAGTLALSPNCEGFWLHKSLDTRFFTDTYKAFGPIKA